MNSDQGKLLKKIYETFKKTKLSNKILNPYLNFNIKISILKFKTNSFSC